MAEQFYTILTAVGKAKIANAAALGKKIELTEMALGDGGGSYYNPTEDQTELRNEVWRGAVSNVDVDGENPNWIVIQTVVPGQHGGFMIREAGVFDNEGDLIAVGKYPETYKPAAADGSIKDLVIRMILEVSNTASVVLKVDPTGVATQRQVDEAEARAKAYTDQEIAKVDSKITVAETQEVIIEGGIGSIPSNAAEGQISVVLYGLTATQLIKNGNFADGLTGWNGVANFTLEDGMLKLTTGSGFVVWQDVNIIAGHKYYISYGAISDGNAEIGAVLRQGATTISEAITSGKTTTYSRRSGIVQATQDGDRLAFIRGTQTDNWVKIKDIMLVDLTEHGLDNKTVAELDAIFAHYFEGTKSTISAGRFRAVGKNLFDPHKFVETVRKFSPSSKFTILDGEEVIELYPEGLTDPQRRLIEGIFKPNTQYTISFKGKKISSDTSVRFRIFYTDGSFTDAAGITNQTNFTTRTTVSAAGKTIDFIGIVSGFPGGIYMKEIQLEEGAAATEYEPYRESNAYVIAKDPTTGKILEARSLPNGVKDEFNLTQGKLIKRLDEIKLQEASWSIRPQGETTNFYSVDASNFFPYERSNWSGFFQIHNYPVQQYFSNASLHDSFDGYGIYAVARTLRIKIPKSEIDGDITVEKVKQWFEQKQVTLIYQLASPIITQYQPQSLIGYPNGTIYWEPVVKDIAIYNNGVSVADTTLPIKTLLKVIKYDPKTKTEIDITSTCTISPDKLSFTSTALSNGDTVIYEYEYDESLTTIPTLEVTANMNLKSAVDSVNKAVDNLSKHLLEKDNYVVENIQKLGNDINNIQQQVQDLDTEINTLQQQLEAVENTYTATIDTTWEGTEPPYTKTVTITGISETDNPIVDVMMSGDYATDQQIQEEWAKIYRITTANDSITLYATEKPTIDLPIQIKVVR